MNRHPSAITGILLCLSCTLPAAGTAAQPDDLRQSTSDISAAAGSAGRIAVNASAGIGSAQTNVATIASSSAHAIAAIDSRQQASLLADIRGGAQSLIGADAFRGATGIITINQSSGAANVQANLAALALAPTAEVSIDQLGQITAASGNATHASGASGIGGPRRRQLAAIADTAFVGVRGLVQINQLAGSGNSTANIFSLTVTSGVP